MANTRLIIPVEFSKNSIEDLELYAILKDFTHPGSLIKDILRGKIPVSVLHQEDQDYMCKEE